MEEEKIKKGIDARVKLKVDAYHKLGLSAKEIIEALKNDKEIDRKDIPVSKQVTDRCCYLERIQKEDKKEEDNSIEQSF